MENATDLTGLTDLLSRSKLIEEELVSLRRELHATPELGFAEFKTAEFLKEKLTQYGYKVRGDVGGTGLVADLGTGQRIAVRAEMDAVAITETNRSHYSSRVAGISHACGHDANMACALGAALLIAEATRQKGPDSTDATDQANPADQADQADQVAIRIIMQPAAEPVTDKDGKTGTQSMIEAGALDDVAAIITLHVDTTMPTGQVGIIAELPVVSHGSFKISVSRPAGDQKGEPACELILASARLVEAIYDFKQNRELVGDSDLTIHSLQAASLHPGGDANEATIEGAINAPSKEGRARITSLLEEQLAAVRKSGYACQIDYDRQAGAQQDSQAVAGTMLSVAAELLGEGNASILKRKSWTEDFSAFTEHVPGALMLLGAEIKHNRRVAHSATFDIDESSLTFGAAILAGAALRLCQTAKVRS